MTQVRIQKVIAASGMLSRRKAEEALMQGRVSVNGHIVTELGTRVDPERDEIRIDSVLLGLPEQTQVILFHKPRRVITTKSDPQNRKTIMDFFPKDLHRLKPVGRLDFDSEGLILLTDDGDLANRIAHPRYGIRKIYHVWTQGHLQTLQLEQLIRGVPLEDGSGKFESVEVLGREVAGSVLEVTVSEGRNRFVRRMLDGVGTPVIRLKRVQIGNLALGSLPSGQYRKLDPKELSLLKKDLGL